jgi:hypothetical protein
VKALESSRSLSGSIRRQKPNQVSHAANRQQTNNGRGEGERRVQAAHGWCGFGCGGRFGRRRGGPLGHGCGAGAWCQRRGRSRRRRRRWRGGRSRRRSRRATGRQRWEFDRRRRRRLRGQIDADGFFLGLDLAGFLLRRNGATRDVRNVESEECVQAPNSVRTSPRTLRFFLRSTRAVHR